MIAISAENSFTESELTVNVILPVDESYFQLTFPFFPEAAAGVFPAGRVYSSFKEDFLSGRSGIFDRSTLTAESVMDTASSVKVTVVRIVTSSLVESVTDPLVANTATGLMFRIMMIVSTHAKIFVLR